MEKFTNFGEKNHEKCDPLLKKDRFLESHDRFQKSI